MGRIYKMEKEQKLKYFNLCYYNICEFIWNKDMKCLEKNFGAIVKTRI